MSALVKRLYIAHAYMKTCIHAFIATLFWLFLYRGNSVCKPVSLFSCLSSVTQSMDLYNFVFHILTDKALSLPLSSLSLDAQHWLEAQSLGQVERPTGF